MERGARIALALGLVAVGVFAFTRRASAAARPRDQFGALAIDELGPIHVTAPPLDIPDVARIDAPPTLGARLEVVVDQVKDALKGLGLWSRKVPARFRELFAMAGAQYRLPPGLLEAVAYRESRFREDIITGEVRSSAGAVGIMQIVPKWHPDVGLEGALDPVRAVPYAAKYLRQLFEQFGTWKLALAAYNWGPGNLKGKTDGKGWPEETRVYVAEISENAGLA